MQPPLIQDRLDTVDTIPKFRILVVDDHADLATAMAMMLRYEGHVTATAFNGHAAITMAKVFLPQVVILDIDLPDCNGYEVARALRSDFGQNEMLIIAISGRTRDPEISVGPSDMINQYMLKPVDLEMLFGSLRPSTDFRDTVADN